LHFFRPAIDSEADSSSDFEDTRHNACHTCVCVCVCVCV